MTEVNIAELERLPAFAGLGAAALRLLATEGTRRRLAAGEVAAREGDPAGEMFAILAGTVRISAWHASGGQMTYQVHRAGELVGEVALIDGEKRSATIVADSECRLLIISRELFGRLIDGHPEFVWVMLRRMARLTRWLTTRLYETQMLGVPQRLYTELLRLAGEQGDAPIRVSDTDLASRIGTSREYVSRLNGELRASGVIERSRTSLRVVRPETLRDRLAGPD